MSHWFLPTGGDGRQLGGSVHGLGIGAAAASQQGTTGESQRHSSGERVASLGYLTQLARAADALGYEGVLTPTSPQPSGVHGAGVPPRRRAAWSGSRAAPPGRLGWLCKKAWHLGDCPLEVAGADVGFTGRRVPECLHQEVHSRVVGAA